jgi:hypothetical protein
MACRGTALLFIITSVGITAAFLYSKVRSCQFLTRLYIAYLPNRIAVSCDVSRCGVVCVYRYGRFGEMYCVHFYVQQLKQLVLIC